MLQWCLITTVNSLRPNDAIWRHRPWSTLTQVMACCLTAPSHNLNKMLSWERWPLTQTSFISMQYKNALVKIRIWKLFSFVLFCILSVIFTRLWLKCQRMFWWASCISARHAGSFDCLMTSLILITMDNGRGHCAYWQSCKVPNQTHRGKKKN